MEQNSKGIGRTTQPDVQVHESSSWKRGVTREHQENGDGPSRVGVLDHVPCKRLWFSRSE